MPASHLIPCVCRLRQSFDGAVAPTFQIRHEATPLLPPRNAMGQAWFRQNSSVLTNIDARGQLATPQWIVVCVQRTMSDKEPTSFPIAAILSCRGRGWRCLKTWRHTFDGGLVSAWLRSGGQPTPPSVSNSSNSLKDTFGSPNTPRPWRSSGRATNKETLNANAAANTASPPTEAAYVGIQSTAPQASHQKIL